MKVLAGIVSFQPDVTSIRECIRSAVRCLDSVIVVDNGSDNIEEINRVVNQIQGTVIIRNESNLGIAKALNQIFAYAETNDYDYVLCLDQDSFTPGNMLTDYKELLESYPEPESVGIICPRIHDRLTNRTWPTISEDEKHVIVDNCITSGSLNSVAIWKEIGGFDEQLFIDLVDDDYAFRIRQKGYDILLCQSVVLDHQIGNTKIKCFLGKTLYIRNHSAFRKYYMVRNMIYVGKKHYGRLRIRDLGHAVLFTFKTILYENDKWAKYKACCKGFFDGCKMKPLK